jgi:quinol monooxygenase YgiN
MSTPSSSAHGNAQVVTLVVTMTFKPEHEHDFLAMAREFTATVHATEPDVLLYTLHKHPSEPHTYVWVERYRNEAALGHHMSTPAMQAVFPKLQNYLAGPPSMLKLDQVVPA